MHTRSTVIPESLSASVLVMALLPVMVAGLVAVTTDRQWPLVRTGTGGGAGYLRFNTRSAEADLFLRRMKMTYLPSLLQVIAGTVRLRDALAKLNGRER